MQVFAFGSMRLPSSILPRRNEGVYVVAAGVVVLLHFRSHNAFLIKREKEAKGEEMEQRD